MIPCVIAFLLGTTSLFFCDTRPSYKILFLFAGLLLPFCFIKILKPYKFSWVLAYIAGLLWASFHASLYLAHRVPESLENQPIKLTGSIVGLPENLDEQTVRFEFDIETSEPSSRPLHSARVRLCFQDPPMALQVGDRYLFTVKLKSPRGFINPGSFDKARYFLVNRLTAEGNVLAKYPVTRLENTRTYYKAWLDKINQIRRKIQAEIFRQTNKGAFAGILAALVVGTKEGISPTQWEYFRNTGTAHLLAISGLHVGLVAGFVFVLVRLGYRGLPKAFINRIHFPMQKIAACLAMLAAIAYALLAGFTVPTQRAVIMILVFMVNLLRQRKINAWRSYFIAMGLTLLIDPLSCLGLGFWLSFLAVGILLYGMQNRIAPKGLWWLWGRAQWVVFLGLFPVSFLAFQQMTWIAPFVNLVMIPWVSFTVVPFVLLGSIFTLISSNLGKGFIFVAQTSLELLWPCLEAGQGLIKKMVWQHQPNSLALGFSVIGILLLIAPKGFPARRLGFLFLLPVFIQAPPIIPQSSVRFTVLDVGQGLSAIVETQHHLLLFDTGPSLTEQTDTGERVVLPYLATRQKTFIDKILISHVDDDHVGGLNSIVKKISTANISSSDPKAAALRLTGTQTSIDTCRAGQQWQWDGVDFEILHPSASTTSKKKNDKSCVLRIQTGQHSILLTGDIEATAEKLLLKNDPKKLAASIMVVPHHGSKTSSTAEFIQAVHPQYAIIPVGYRNQYGHPHAEVVNRYQASGAQILSTALSGALIFDLKPDSPLKEPIRYRFEQKRFWQF